MLTKDLLVFQEPAIPMFKERGNLLLAMDMGLGKTVVAICCAEELLGEGKIDFCLVVVPPGLKFQWAEKLAEFTDLPSHKIRFKNDEITVPRPPGCIVIDGTPAKRAEQYRQINDRTDYVILGYENVISEEDAPFVRALRPKMAVLDEITEIKGASSKRSQHIKRILNCKYRLGLTGTLVENRPEEAYFIFQWIDPHLLPRADIFDKTFFKRSGNGDVVVSNENLPLLHNLLSKAMYRKRADDPDVAPFMPTVVVDQWDVSMTSDTERAYTVMAADLLNALYAAKGSGGGFNLAAHYGGGGKLDEATKIGKVMAVHQAIEMLLDHPDVLIASAEHYASSEQQRRKGVKKKTWPGSKYCYTAWQEGLVDDVYDSAKLSELVLRVDAILRNDPKAKVLVYTYFTEMLPLMDAELSWHCARYSGKMTATARNAAKAQFTQGNARVFLSSHAGAYGQDMYMANHLVNYDLPWSGGVSAQINGRHVRASSLHETVHIHNMITAGTVEERKRDMLGYKRRLARAIEDGTGADKDGSIKNDIATLTAWLEGRH